MSSSWQHPSVKKLVKLSDTENPVNAITGKARSLALNAFNEGWSGPPYDPIELAQMLGIDIVPNDAINDARIIPIENTYRIEYNPFQNSRRINFSLAHEIVHTLFPDCNERIRNREAKGSTEWEVELLCNIGAAELLLPYGKFSFDVNNMPINLDSIKFLADKYKVSIESVLIRLCEVTHKTCLFAITSFSKNDQKELVVDYYQSSKASPIKLGRGTKIPKSSKVYDCLNPGWTAYAKEQWPAFKGQELMVYGMGLPPLKNSTNNRVGILIAPSVGEEVNNKLYTVIGDATHPTGEGTKIIAQVVNTQGGLGAGFGKAMAKQWPASRSNVYKWRQNKKIFRLGKTSLVSLAGDIFVFQMIAQDGIKKRRGSISLKYSVLRDCLIELALIAKEHEASVHMPLIGAGQAGGDWNVIEGIIEEEIIRRGVDVKVYLLHDSHLPKKPSSQFTLFY